jgi:formylglycine-generating enzyme required for sulfatase activity
MAETSLTDIDGRPAYGGTFRMGDDNAYPEEAPIHTVTISGFWIDEYAVTNAGFAAFVADPTSLCRLTRHWGANLPVSFRRAVRIPVKNTQIADSALYGILLDQ